MNNMEFEDEMLTSEAKRPSKRTLNDLLSSKEVITGKEVVQRIIDQEKLRKEFDRAVEDELRNRLKR